MNRMYIRYILSIVAVVVLMTNEMFASKAVPGSIQVTLQDGRSVSVSLRGDEHVNFLMSSDGEMIVENGGIYRVATAEEQEEILKACKELEKETQESQAKAIGSAKVNSGEGISGEKLFPHKGTPKVLVLMAEFADEKFTFTQREIDSLLNSDAILTRIVKNSVSYSSGVEDSITRLSSTRSYSSVAQYFNDCSNGQFKPQFDVYGPYTLSQGYAVYGKGKDDNMRLFIPEVCSLADRDVDFSEYDADGDGYVDLVYVIYAGYSANWTANSSDCIWPKSGPMKIEGATAFGVYDGKTVLRYGVNGELLAYPAAGRMLNGIGVFCHEFSHTMGLPDFYPANMTDVWSVSDYDNQSLEEWDLMDGGENSVNGCWPPMYSAFERELMGWMKIDTLDSPADLTIKPILHGGNAYRILNDNDPTGNEYWILEAISTDLRSEGWQQYMPGKGLLITHVNYDPESFQTKNNVNAVKGKPRITVIPADGYLPSSYKVDDNLSYPYSITTKQFRIEQAGDSYPGATGVTEFNNYKAYTGTIDKPITNIVLNDDFSVSFTFMGGQCYDISLTASPQEGGTVDGGGTYHVDSIVALVAIPAEGYRFLGWSDGVTDSLRYITVSESTEFTAQFKKILKGDANDEGIVSMADANMVVNVFISGDQSENFVFENADVNDDKQITMADANAIVNIYLGQNEVGQNNEGKTLATTEPNEENQQENGNDTE